MIKLNRDKNHRWIFQKNVSSKEVINGYLEAINSIKDTENKQAIQDHMRANNLYKGRSEDGSLSTMGVRFSQMCFYMFGYRKQNSSNQYVFMPAQTTINILSDDNNDVKKNMLVNLFSMQYPHPNSKTHKDFSICCGRLILQLLLEEKLNKRLYIDEFIWFLPFITSINEKLYYELIDSILEYRQLSFKQKKDLFESVYNYNDVFANCTHECKYYFMRIYEGFGVFQFVVDSEHNGGNLFKFKHGTGTTLRHDGVTKTAPGYIQLNPALLNDASLLLNKFSVYEPPVTLSDDNVCGKEEWYTQLYDVAPLQYLSEVFDTYKLRKDISEKIVHMQDMAVRGSVDGKDFENSLQPVFELFDKVIKATVISGSGDTDVLCVVDGTDLDYKEVFKVNVEGKCRSSINSMNPMRPKRHLELNNSKYCIVVSPKVTPGAISDIKDLDIVLLKSDVLARYVSKECLFKNSFEAKYAPLHTMIRENIGSDISNILDDYIDKVYGISLAS